MNQNRSEPEDSEVPVPPAKAKALNPFWIIVQENLRIVGFALALGTGGIVADLVAGFGPTWPPKNDLATRSFIPIATAVILLAVLMNVFQVARNLEIPIAVLERRRTKSFYFLLVSLTVYIVVFVCLTFADPDDGRRAKGFWKRADLQQALEAPPNLKEDDITPNFNPSSSDEELLEAAQYRAHFIWRQWTINLVEVVLVLTWFIFFVSVIECFGMFQLLQRRLPAPTWIEA